MSIDKQVFVELVGELEMYYKREFTPFVKRVWYKHLSDCLTTVEFQRAVEQAIVANEFMPTPQQLVEAIKGNSTTQAFEEWELCVLAASRGEIGIADSLTPQGKFALRAVGGVSELGRINQDSLRWAKKEFVSAWKGWKPAAGSAALSPAQEQSALLSAVDSEAVSQIRSFTEKLSFNGRANKKSPQPNG